jgi:hypothetical protein
MNHEIRWNQDISKEAYYAVVNSVALIRVKIIPVTTINVISRMIGCKGILVSA